MQVLTLSSAPATEPVTTAEAKSHARVDSSDDDTLIGGLITAARQWAEWYTQRAFITQTWDLKLDAFPSEPLELPKAPLVSVSSVTYVDSAGASQTWAADEYVVKVYAGQHAPPGRLWLAYGEAFPITLPVLDAVTIRFVAGYGAAAAVPEEIKLGIKVLVAELYKAREESVVGEGPVFSAPFSVHALLWPFRVVKF